MLIYTPYISTNKLIWNTHLYPSEPKYDFPGQNEKKRQTVIPILLLPDPRVIKKIKTCQVWSILIGISEIGDHFYKFYHKIKYTFFFNPRDKLCDTNIVYTVKTKLFRNDA